jgi:hypothetical protein
VKSCSLRGNVYHSCAWFVLHAFSAMVILKQKAMTTGNVRHQPSTIRFQFIARGPYLVKRGRSTVLKLSEEGRRRHFLQHHFDQLEVRKPPFKFSNARSRMTGLPN